MALIITNTKTLKDIAVIYFKQYPGKKTIEQKGDFAIIKSDEKVIGINVRNFKNYFSAKQGPHTLNGEQIEVLKKEGIEFQDEPFFFTGEIVNVEKHPKADKLFLISVEADGVSKFVTNSPLATLGKKVVFADTYSVLPDGLVVVPTKIMGVESTKSLVSAETLHIENKEGLFFSNDESGKPFIF